MFNKLNQTQKEATMSAIFGEYLTLGQHNGPDITLRVFGDEFYARYETLDGYTVVYDLDRGRYCYAELEAGHFTSSGIPMGKPIPYGIHRRLKEEAPVRNLRFKSRYAGLRPDEDGLNATSNVMRTFGPNSGLLGGRQVAHGNVKGLTLLVDFPDKQSSISQNEVDAMLNNETYSQDGNFCSVRRYYQLMSGGKLDYTNRVVGPIRLSRNQSYYINNLLIREALEIAIQDHGLNLSEFDSRNQGMIDALSVMYAGRTLYAGDLWPHNSRLNLNIGGYRAYFYTIQSLGRRRVDLSIGTFCHESGHMLCRFPDLYDYGERNGDFEKSSGLGQYCLMSWGNHLNRGKTPSPICSYLRDLIGWCGRLVDLNNAGSYTAHHADYDTVMRYSTDRPNEYFIVENRSRLMLDAHLPDSGLAIYHCDTRGSNEYQDGTPQNHYQCALLQADGRFDLEHTERGGDTGDLYEAIRGTALNSKTVPNADVWDGSDSGLSVSDIGAAGETIDFRVGTTPADIINESRVADMIIPDDNPEGINSDIIISASGTLTYIAVTVAITHTYRKDLRVRLISPSGKIITLHEDKGGSQDNLHLDLDSLHSALLKELQGESIKGRWQLNVSDLVKDDRGRLDQWDLTLHYDSDEKYVEKSLSPELSIPDHDTTGVQSMITVEDTGIVKDITVDVAITHTFRGDLQVELIAPSGQHALLHNGQGGSRNNLEATYTMETTPTLRAFGGETLEGIWRLQVKDLAKQDTGVLDQWKLKITY